MRFIAILLIISMSGLANGQNIRINFSDTLLHENFLSNNYNFPQKYNAIELFIVENGQYRLKRLKKEGKSVALAKMEAVSEFEVRSSFSLQKTKNKNRSCGLVLHSQADGSGGISIEINAKGKLKVTKLLDNQVRFLSGTPKEEGWIKAKQVNKKGRNNMIVKVAKGYYDIYINNEHAYTAFDAQFTSGQLGYYIGEDSEMLVYDITVLEERKGLEVPTNNGGGSVSVGNDGINDPSYKEVINLFKVKIDKQEQEIKTMQKELDRCRSTLNYDTAMISNYKTISADNRVMSRKLDSTSRALEIASRRLTELESLKENIESGSNGDLVLNLASIVAELKEENQELKQNAQRDNLENKKLKQDKDVLLREVDRLKYMLGLKDN